MKRVFLYFGSFNPVHKGHVALAEYVIEQGLCDSVVLIVSPQNPHKNSDTLLPELTRFEMTEIACRTSKYPTAIQASAVEFILDRPSYTIATLRYLTEIHGHDMHFSILMGADIIPHFHEWRDYREILDSYDIYVYPRNGYTVDRYLDKIHFLADAPVFDGSSTDVRNTYAAGRDASDMLPKEVAAYISSHGLFGAVDSTDDIAKGREFFRRNEWGEALNSFRRVLHRDPHNKEANAYVKMIEDILAFRYKDIYNP